MFPVLTSNIAMILISTQLLSFFRSEITN
ncbi:hypothetical protein Goari_005191 [Gossypium aridum]|uniref:Uncharacterized protein n=1 Tax=Gossypium aridum TaxID=34290 RepID=A0A7J8Y7I5_GOSAI|nr:hypothetical protein [Gossypium aridum]